jgi:hypothetical protein
VYFDQSARYANDVTKPYRWKITVIDHLDGLFTHGHWATNAVVILNHIHGNIQTKHAWGAQHQVAMADVDLYPKELLLMCVTTKPILRIH